MEVIELDILPADIRVLFYYARYPVPHYPEARTHVVEFAGRYHGGQFIVRDRRLEKWGY